MIKMASRLYPKEQKKALKEQDKIAFCEKLVDANRENFEMKLRIMLQLANLANKPECIEEFLKKCQEFYSFIFELYKKQYQDSHTSPEDCEKDPFRFDHEDLARIFEALNKKFFLSRSLALLRLSESIVDTWHAFSIHLQQIVDEFSYRALIEPIVQAKNIYDMFFHHFSNVKDKERRLLKDRSKLRDEKRILEQVEMKEADSVKEAAKEAVKNRLEALEIEFKKLENPELKSYKFPQIKDFLPSHQNSLIEQIHEFEEHLKLKSSKSSQTFLKDLNKLKDNDVLLLKSLLKDGEFKRTFEGVFPLAFERLLQKHKRLGRYRKFVKLDQSESVTTLKSFKTFLETPSFKAPHVKFFSEYDKLESCKLDALLENLFKFLVKYNMTDIFLNWQFEESTRSRRRLWF